MNISPQQKQSSLIGAGNKSDCFIVDLLTSQLEKEISKKGEIIIFLTEQYQQRMLILQKSLRISLHKVKNEEV